MVLFQFFAGLLGLGFLVLIHEAGHFFAARSLGIQVETFSIGWGKAVWKHMGKDGVAYQIAAFPLGGFVLMKGEAQFREALNKGLKEFPYEKGSFFSAHPLKRVLVALAGPAINIVFAILVFSVIYGIGYEYTSHPAQILLAEGTTPAREAGLQDGDVILRLGNQQIQHFSDLQQKIATNPRIPLETVYLRGGTEFTTTLTPRLDNDRGIGLIGVYPAIRPLIAQAGPSLIEQGILPGDLITSIQGQEIDYTIDLFQVIEQTNQAIVLGIRRGNENLQITVTPDFDDQLRPVLPLGFQGQVYRTPGYNFFGSIGRGFQEVGQTLQLTLRSLGMLFSGLNPTRAVSGPVRISVMVGEAATLGFTQGIGTGFRLIFHFLSIISIALAFGNMLPIPVLDGGQTLMYSYEFISKKRLTPKAITVFQTFGAVIVVGLLFFALFSDLLFIFT